MTKRHRDAGREGGHARADALSGKRKAEIARQAARARWRGVKTVKVTVAPEAVSKAKREGVSLRALILGWLKSWTTGTVAAPPEATHE